MSVVEMDECKQDTTGITSFEILATTFGAAICITNILVIIAIASGDKKMQKGTFYCIGNLAVADMLAGCFLLWVFGLQKVRSCFDTLV